MATAKEKGAGKSMFLKEYLVNHPGAGKEAVDAAWRAAGHEGTISQSLISKIRGEIEATSRSVARVESQAMSRDGSKPTTVLQAVIVRSLVDPGYRRRRVANILRFAKDWNPCDLAD